MNNPFYSKLLAIATVFGMTGVAVGAFGAHFLKSRIDASELDVLRTGVLYLFIHTLVILVVVLLGKADNNSSLLKSAGLFYVAGIALFSGSLFFIATRSLTGFDIGYFGILTPVGGMCFLIGWMLLFLYSFTNRI